MSGEMIAGLLGMAIMGAIMYRQQRTIDRLTDKLMAGDYRVYKSLEGVKEEDASPPREEEPVSWHDYN
jgi:hypothetical protein